MIHFIDLLSTLLNAVAYAIGAFILFHVAMFAIAKVVWWIGALRRGRP